MQRRKFIAGMGSLAAAGAAGIGTGAFSTVNAERSVSVSTAADSEALLALDPTGENSAYASGAGTGAVTIDISDSNDSGFSGDPNGVNTNALTQIFDIFKVRNQGTQAAVVYVDPTSVPEDLRTSADDSFGIDPQATGRPNGDFEKPENTIPDKISLSHIYDQDFPASTTYYGGGDDALEEYVLEPGESFDFGLYVDTRSGDFSGSVSMEIVADTSIVPDSY
jgi:hypothetical protein